METYDLVIIGGSAAAATAGIYAARRNLNFKIITKEFGGEVATSGEIGNWPGVPKTDGLKLAEEFRAHLKSYGVEPVEGVWVEKIHKRDDGIFEIWSREAGVQKRGEDGEGAGAGGNKGVSYCTVCDGPLFGGKTVAVIGGGNSALESALMMADIASKVYVLNKN